MEPMKSRQAESGNPSEFVLFGHAVPNGNGGFIVTPLKPVPEISSKRAAVILGVSRSHVSNIVNMPEAQKILRWRFATDKNGKRLFTLASVLAYRDHLQQKAEV